MQLQIECNQIPLKLQPCCFCRQRFERTEAIIIICDNQGKKYGEACSRCLSKGFDWLSDRFDQLGQADHSKKITSIRRTQALKTPIGV
ncbi:MAG: hypothetical protein RBJ76_03730 [Stenomitos frigidus ULC029]